MNKFEKAIIAKAVEWFDGRRPLIYSREYHLENPRINQMSGSGERLAEAVAKYLKTRRKQA